MEQLLILAVWLPFIGFLINGALSLRENRRKLSLPLLALGP